jgi:Rad3-related DNA helicase
MTVLREQAVDLDTCSPADLGLPARFTEFRQIQREAGAFALWGPEGREADPADRRRFTCMSLPTGCVYGGAKVTVNRAGIGRTKTIEEWYLSQSNGRRRPEIKSMIRGHLDYRMGLIPMRDEEFVYSGQRLTWELVLSNGNYLRATPDHGILTERGWIPLGSLRSSDLVICEGVRPKKPKAQYLQNQGLRFHKYAGRCGSFRPRGNHIEGRLYRVPRHRLVMEAHINGIDLESLIEICRYNPVRAERLELLDPEEVLVHHKDENPKNNDIDNLEMMSIKEHTTHHGTYNASNFSAPLSIKITRTNVFSVEPTFDAKCVEPHNFLANGIVVHNSGKSLSAHIVGRMYGQKYVVLTATRALEDQMVSDGFDLINIRGRANYQCRDFDPLHPDKRWDCAKGEEEDCRMYGSPNCAYGQAAWQAKHADCVLTNYAYWMNVRSRGMGALESPKSGAVGLLICDEVHQAANCLSSFLGTWVSWEDLHRYANAKSRAALQAGKGADWGRVNALWLDALGDAWTAASAALDELTDEHVSAAAARRNSSTVRRMMKVIGALERVVSHGEDGNWIWRQTRNGVSFDCVWPGKYAERYLWSGVPNIVLMSATLRPKAVRMLGVGESKQWFREWPRVFPAALGPVWWVPTGRMGWKESEEEKLKSVALFDRMCEYWLGLGHKGLLHTVSFERMRWYQEHSKFAQSLICADDQPGGAMRAFEKHAASEQATVLTGPNYMAGWDFKAGLARWQLIPKIPFAGKSDPVVLSRMESDSEYYDYDAMQSLVQACGRCNRDFEDWAVTVISDDAVGGFISRARQHAPRWFGVKKWTGGEGTVPGVPKGITTNGN